MYEKQGFYSGQKLQASQLVAMEDGIINAEKLAAGAANIEQGSGADAVNAIQQLSDSKSTTFDFTGKNTFAYEHTADESLTGAVQYGASNKCAATVGGKSAARGSRSFSSGTSTIAHGSYSHTEGSNTVAYGTSTHAEGTGSYAYGEGAHAEGGSYAIGKRSHAEGGQCQAIGDNSHAEGSQTIATTAFSHTEGLRTHADGAVAHAEGGDTYASGDYSHAEGQDTHALGEYSHTEGQDVQVNESSRCSHGGGWKTRVKASYAFGHGAGISVDRECQAVFGQYNEANKNAMFIIGNGSDGNPLNIFEVLNHGDVQFTYQGTTYSLLKLITKLIEKGYINTNDIKA